SGLNFTPHWTQQFDFPEVTVGSSGPLPNDRKHQIKGYGSYRWPFGLTTGFAGYYFTGTPISRFGFFDTIWLRFVEPRGSAGRTPELWKVDLHLSYPFVRRDRLTLDAIVQCFNLTDEQAVNGVDEIWTFANGVPLPADECGGPGTGPGTNCPEGNPNWGQPLAFQQGRSLMFGLKANW
ncbi:MAG: hypothetical protein KY432_11335, partial [Acidobacteria bacterium]|nr:hypothetical protein [Acidobacteriota bacterium]